MSERPKVFDLGYHMMWSLLDNVTPAQIKAEIEVIEDSIKQANLKAADISRTNLTQASKLRVLKTMIEREEAKNLFRNFTLTEDHKKIIKAIDWQTEDPYTYFRVDQVCDLLEYQKPNDNYSDEQYEIARKLLKEIPIAVSKFFNGENS